MELFPCIILISTPYAYLSYTTTTLKQGDSAHVELIRMYQGSPFNGYVFKIRNISSRKKLEIDVRNITVGDPNQAVLSQSDEAVLFPKGKGPQETLVRVVAKNSATSRDVILAMEVEEPKENSKGSE